MNFLIVEDDFISRRLLGRFLEPFGEFDVAVNGEEAVEAVKVALSNNEHYDAICLDIMMPKMDGQETLLRIRDLEARANLPLGQGAKIIMTSSLEDNKNVRDAFKSSADGYVVKPIDKKKLYQTLQDLGLELVIAN